MPTRPNHNVYSVIDSNYSTGHGLPLGWIRKVGNKTRKLAAVLEVSNDHVDRFGGAYCIYRDCYTGHDSIDVILQGLPSEYTVVNVGVGVVPDRKIIGTNVKDYCINPTGSYLLGEADGLAGFDNIFRGRASKRPIVFVPAAARAAPTAPWAYVNAAIALQLFDPVEGCRGLPPRLFSSARYSSELLSPIMPKWTGAPTDEPPNVMIVQQSTNGAMKKRLYDIRWYRGWIV